eukprot:7045552-Pyramimonas_sp.AAC.1
MRGEVIPAGAWFTRTFIWVHLGHFCATLRALWVCGSVGQWVSGSVGQWVCGSAGLWVCRSAGLGVCGSVGLGSVGLGKVRSFTCGSAAGRMAHSALHFCSSHLR